MQKLIKLQDNRYVVVDDSEIKDGDFIYEYDQYNINTADSNYVKNENDFKIIAGISELPSIDFSLLSEEDIEEIGWISQQTKMWDCEVEMEEKLEEGWVGEWTELKGSGIYEPRITNNKIKVIKILGREHYSLLSNLN